MSLEDYGPEDAAEDAEDILAQQKLIDAMEKGFNTRLNLTAHTVVKFNEALEDCGLGSDEAMELTKTFLTVWMRFFKVWMRDEW